MRYLGRVVLARVPAAFCVFALYAGTALAQTADSTDPQAPVVARPTPPPPARRALSWTVEVHGGFVGMWAPTDGFGVVPAGGADFVTTSDMVSPSASSWYFGHGAAWLNQFAKPAAANLQIAPLDTSLTTAAVRRQRGPSFGVRVTREITQRFDLELVVDHTGAELVASPGVVSALQATSASFSTVWLQLLGGLPASSASSQLGGTDRYGSRTVATAALDYFISFGRVTPYVAVGGGVAANSGSVEATLTGDVQFQVNTFSEHQTDNVDIVFGERRWEPVAVLGAGLVGRLTRRIGWRVDLRDYLIASGLRTTVSATPAMASGSGVTDLVNSTGEPIQFNTASMPASTLGLPIANVTTFTGTGWHKQLSATFGVLLRF